MTSVRDNYRLINARRARFNAKAEQSRISEVARIANYIQFMKKCSRSEALREAEQVVEQVRYMP